MKNTKFSVLIPVYKKEKPEFFDAALNSVFKQTSQPSEVVICEDGPLVPKLDSVVEKYREKYPKVVKIVKIKENRGLGPTLHDGVLACNNEIIFRMDSDDISKKHRFEKQLDALIDGNFDVVGSNISEYDEKMEELLGDRIVPEKNDDIIEFAKRRNPFNHQTVCFKRSSVIEAGNYIAMNGFEDYYLWVRMAQKGCKFHNIQETLVDVRGGVSMVGRRGGKKYLDSVIYFEKQIAKEGFISLKQCYENIALRTLILGGPNAIRQRFYYKFLRSKK